MKKRGSPSLSSKSASVDPAALPSQKDLKRAKKNKTIFSAEEEDGQRSKDHENSIKDSFQQSKLPVNSSSTSGVVSALYSSGPSGT